MFEGEPVELIGGQLVVAEPQAAYHATAVGAVDDALRAVLPPGWIVRSQMPLALDDGSAPEPDLVVVSGTRADYRQHHPARPALAIEVAESSLGFDRQYKGRPYGWRYRSVETLTPPAIVVPLALASARIAVAALLP